MLRKHLSSTICVFVLGMVLGALLAYLNSVVANSKGDGRKSRYISFLANNNISDSKKAEREIAANNNNLLIDKVNIFCWVMTQPISHQTKAHFSKLTWARHCNRLIFISEKQDDSLPATKVKAIPSRNGLWDKVKEAFILIHHHFDGKYDWVLKADDDSYVDMMALRRLLLPLNASKPLHLGEKMNAPRPDFHLPQGFMAGGGGYVLSKEAVRRFVAILKDPRGDAQTGCRKSGFTAEEDPRIGECLHDANVTNIDTRDPDGFATFSQFNAEQKLIDNRFRPNIFWYWGFQPWQSTKDGVVGCCSNRMVSFHYMSPFNMFAYQYLIDKVNPVDAGPTLRRP